ncbi:MAG: MBL fold metallo-hydrolase [Betaproteobacteria bacterium]|nr:MBL fold metallo-hydrolase [Betaproteobacteria bacterium]MBI2959570.1 MBL fold metallo-hydrolase [Betaproteobacteria bacterium]
MKFGIIPVTPFEQNCSLLMCEKTGALAIVDPGGDIDRIVGAIEKIGATPERIFLTHGHVDHAGGTAELARRLRLPVEGPQREDRFLIDQLPNHGRSYGFGSLEAFVPERWLEDGDRVRFGEVELAVIHCPGHTPGHVVYFSAADRLAIVGDVLFAGSIGRTDFPRGDHAALIHSITQKLWPLGDDVTFIPGHGPLSTFGEERASNPFVCNRALEQEP